MRKRLNGNLGQRDKWNRNVIRRKPHPGPPKNMNLNTQRKANTTTKGESIKRAKKVNRGGRNTIIISKKNTLKSKIR